MPATVGQRNRGGRGLSRLRVSVGDAVDGWDGEGLRIEELLDRDRASGGLEIRLAVEEEPGLLAADELLELDARRRDREE